MAFAPTVRLVVVSGPPGAGKSTLANAIASHLGGTVASFDWLMSGLRAFPDLWTVVEQPLERQREIGWSLLSRVAQQQLSRGGSCVLDLVAREQPLAAWRALATAHGARFHLVECICSDARVHEARVRGRERGIPAWYELPWEDVATSRLRYVALGGPKLVLDAVDDLSANIEQALAFLEG